MFKVFLLWKFSGNNTDPTSLADTQFSILYHILPCVLPTVLYWQISHLNEDEHDRFTSRSDNSCLVWCKICMWQCNAECSENSMGHIVSRGRRRAGCLLSFAIPTWVLCGSVASSCEQVQVFTSIQERNVSTHSARRTPAYSRPVTEVTMNFTLSHIHFFLHLNIKPKCP